MKTIDLLGSLQGREKKDFEAVIKMHKRESLKKLYFFLKKQLNKDVEPKKEALHRVVLGQKYDAAKSYLIRNELRLLNDELEDFLVQKELEKSFKTNPNLYNLWLLRALKERNLVQEFEATFKKSIAKAKGNLEYELMEKMMGLYLRHEIVSQEITAEHYENTIRAGYLKRIKWIQMDAVQKIRASEVMKAFSERTLKVTNPNYPYSDLLQSVDLTSEKINDDYSNYLYLYALSFQQTGLEKIETLQQALVFIETCLRTKMDAENRKLFLLATIALEYYLMGNHRAADDYYQQTFEFATESKQVIRLTVIFNYFSNCIKLKNTQKR